MLADADWGVAVAGIFGAIGGAAGIGLPAYFAFRTKAGDQKNVSNAAAYQRDKDAYEKAQAVWKDYVSSLREQDTRNLAVQNDLRLALAAKHDEVQHWKAAWSRMEEALECANKRLADTGQKPEPVPASASSPLPIVAAEAEFRVAQAAQSISVAKVLSDSVVVPTPPKSGAS